MYNNKSKTTSTINAIKMHKNSEFYITVMCCNL